MPLDGIFAGYLADEFNKRLKGAKVQKIFQPGRNDLVFHLYNGRNDERLTLSANPSSPIAALGLPPSPNPKDAPGFCMFLRKHLIGADILRVEQPEGERIFRFVFRTRDELGDILEKTLVAELMGRHSNLILLREDQMILDAIRHVDHSVNRFREIMPARPYQDPPAQDKRMAREILNESEALEGQLLPFLNQDSDLHPEKFLMRELAGFSPVLCRELLFRAHLIDARTVSSLTIEDRMRLQNEMLRMLRQIQNREALPALYYKFEQDRIPADFHVIELTHYPDAKPASSPAQAMADFEILRQDKQRADQLRQEVERQLGKYLKQVKRKADLHQKDLVEGEKEDLWKLYGELVQSQIWNIPAKAEYVDVENYYEEDSPLIRIPLDPSRSPAANVEHYFKQYRRAKHKRQVARRLLDEDEAELEWLYSLDASLERADSLSDLKAVQDELRLAEHQKVKSVDEEPGIPINQFLNPGKPGKKKYKATVKSKRKKKEQEPQIRVSGDFRSYRSSSGLLIRSGHNNLENERLTMRKSHANDLWFHARNIPGSHVVLQTEGKQPDPRSIEEAAMVAAWFSAANRHGYAGKVDVDFCPVRNVSKIKGARPGMVNYRDFQTVLVEAKDPRTFLQDDSEFTPD